MFDRNVPENIDDMRPGPELAQVLASLDWERLSDPDLIRVLKAQDRQVAHYQAGRAWTIEKVAERYQDGLEQSFEYREATDGAAAEIAAALCLTRRSGDDEVGFSIELLRHRPVVFEALLFGRIDMRRARVLLDSTQHVTDAVAHMVIESLLDDAPRLTTGQLRHRITKMCIDADPKAAKKRYEMSVEDRRIELRANISGTADLLALDLPPHIAASISRWIHREAIKLRNLGDTRTMDQLRADIYLDLLRRRYKGSKVTKADFGNLDMRVTAETLAGLSEESAELNGFGPVIGDIARQVAEHQEHVERRWIHYDPDTGEPIVSFPRFSGHVLFGV